MSDGRPEHAAVLDFWFIEIEPRAWWNKDAEFDRQLASRFGAVHEMAAAGELSGWRESASGRLAEVIVLDQFSRNIYRGSRLAFACDGMALVLAQEAVRSRADQQMDADQREFLYMPYMHSESPRVHEQAVELFSAPGMKPTNLDFEMKHKAIIDRFGRYPHRNEIIGRASTDEEKTFLSAPGSSF